MARLNETERIPTANANEPIEEATHLAPPGVAARQKMINEPEAMAADQLYGSAPPADRLQQETAGFVEGTSLWKDAWRRLKKNKLAVLGGIVVIFVILAALIGPIILQTLTGYTYASIPSERALVKAMPPSWQHPMGTDPQGRDILARVLVGGRISLMV